jgi:hypothetical protein
MLLESPLTQDAAVRVALLGSPSLQALLEKETARIAEAQRQGRIGNPTLTYERLRDDGKTEIGRILSIGLFELLTLPQRQRIAAAESEAATAQLAISVVASGLGPGGRRRSKATVCRARTRKRNGNR